MAPCTFKTDTEQVRAASFFEHIFFATRRLGGGDYFKYDYVMPCNLLPEKITKTVLPGGCHAGGVLLQPAALTLYQVNLT